ncbi:hypothetical protein VNO78_04639 [Psophocarpus tetragonolobus]|uniref:Uncharacterized protein n=1 Tax=Psophocarpus tetragonolobus TaxID=3891 RepID=A0AAN9T250_PSOTE
MDQLHREPCVVAVTTAETSIDGVWETEELECGHYVGHGYVSNWGMQCHSMRRRRRSSDAQPSTAVSGYRKYLKGTEPEMKRTRRVGKDKSCERETSGSMRTIQFLMMKNKYGKLTHNC